MVLSRQRARDLAALLGFDSQNRTHIATAVSEAVRASADLVGPCGVEFTVRGEVLQQMFEVRIHLPKIRISDVRELLEPPKEADFSVASGFIAAQRLAERFVLEDAPGGGVTMILGTSLPSKAGITEEGVKRIVQEMATRVPSDPVEEIRRQNQELLSVLDELRERQEDLQTLNRQLEDTNSGVLALYSELEHKSADLKRVSDLKSRFISEMSHEFRTPINSILSLSQILLDRIDGDLSSEQEKQVGFINKSAGDLSDLVNDLLDLAKIEAGRIDIHPVEFEVTDLFGALKGILRPLIQTEAVRLVFSDPSDFPRMYTDEGKVSQILRNLIFNAIKFTDEGEVRISAALDVAGGKVTFAVRDTGIGISRENMDIIFEEFIQARTPRQKKVKGTGLGLPLSRKLAELLGGTISCESEFGKGSIFYVALPVRYGEEPRAATDQPVLVAADASKPVVLVIEDDRETRLVYQKYLKGSGFRVIEADTLSKARAILSETKPAAIILDILLYGERDGWEFLGEIKGNEETRDIPVLVLTVLDEEDRGMFLGVDEFCVKPIDKQWLLNALKKVAALEKLLIIDDDEVARYIIKGILAETPYTVIEAQDGKEGLAKARLEKPQVIFLDLVMPGMSGFEVLSRLKEDPETREIPVVIVTSKKLEEEELARLRKGAVDIVSKQTTTRDEALRKIAEALEKTKSQ